MAAPILPRCPLRPLLLLQTALLIGFLGLGVGLGRFPDTNSSMAVLGGMLGVAAMATQDALVKLALKEVPLTAVMTTNIAQLTVDLATLARSRRNPRRVRPVRTPGTHDLAVHNWVRRRLCGWGRLRR
jgi:uncharacterized membrane protein YoaK (UPF0700 family)